MRRDIAIILRRAAVRQQLSQQAIAERAGLHVRTVGRLFRRTTYDQGTAERVADALDVDLIVALYERHTGHTHETEGEP